MRAIVAVRYCIMLAVLTAVAAIAPAAAQAEGGSAVAGWGDNFTEELGLGWKSHFEPSPQTTAGLSNVVSVVAAGNSSFALLANGTVRAWGSSWKGQLGNGSREASGTPIPVKEKTAAGEVRELTGVTAISATYGSGTHVIALLNNGEVATWGASEYGQRGNGESGFEKEGSTTPREYAMVVPGLKHIVAIGTAGTDDYALQEEGGTQTLWAWGENRNGKLGIGTNEGPEGCIGEAAPKQEFACSTRPVAVHLPEGAKVRAVTGGRTSAYALLADGTVLSWGDNNHAQLGNGTATDSYVPVRVCAVGANAPCPNGPYLQGVTAVSGGNMHALALLSNGQAVGWGSNGTGDLGGFSSNECSKTLKTCQLTPKLVSESLNHITAISAGAQFSMVVNEGKAYAFGANEDGSLGQGTWEGPETCNAEGMPCSHTPLQVPGLENVTGISAAISEVSEEHSLAILGSGAGPAPIIKVTPESHSLVVTWTFGLPSGLNPEYRLRAMELETRNFTESFSKTTPCSVSSPCTETLKEVKAGTGEWIPLKEGVPYEVILDTYTERTEAEQLEGQSKYKLINTRKINATPNAVPTVTGVNPTSGSTTGGTPVTITGTNFVAGSTVSFGGASGTNVVVHSKNEITVEAPAHEAGTVDVTVTTPGGTSATSATDRFTYNAPPPTVTKVKPVSGSAAGSTIVTISGTNLTGATAVTFGGTAAGKFEVKTVKGVTTITAESPAHEGGTFDVQVTTPGGTSAPSELDHFKFIPEVTSVIPNTGPAAGGTIVTVTGTGFALGSATAFKFGGTGAKSVNCGSATECTMESPKHAIGPVDVKATVNGVASPKSLGDLFTYE